MTRKEAIEIVSKRYNNGWKNIVDLAESEIDVLEALGLIKFDPEPVKNGALKGVKIYLGKGVYDGYHVEHVINNLGFKVVKADAT